MPAYILKAAAVTTSATDNGNFGWQFTDNGNFGWQRHVTSAR
ncbi:hypothetical protein [Yinghuangia soli]|nr:hypothetical protein [Yinghuangia soli]